MRVLASPTPNGGGLVWDGVALDVTGLKRAEEEQARMTAELGRVYRTHAASQLTRGIGQELAILLQPLFAHGERAVRSLTAGEPVHEDVLAVLAFGEKIRAVSERLADPGGSGEGDPAFVDVVALVAERVETIRKLLPTMVIEAHLGAAGTMVRSTRADMERLVTHLCAWAVGTSGGDYGGLTVTSEAVGEGSTGLGSLKISVGRGGGDILAHEPPGLAQAVSVPSPERGSEFSLAMVCAVAEGCGGRVEMRRFAGDGSVVEVLLPLGGGRDNVIDFQGVSKWPRYRL